MVDTKNVAELSEDVVGRFEALLLHLTETVSTNEKCLEDVQQFQNFLKQFRDGLKQNWETLSGYTGMNIRVVIEELFLGGNLSSVFIRRFDWQ